MQFEKEEEAATSVYEREEHKYLAEEKDLAESSYIHTQVPYGR